MSTPEHPNQEEASVSDAWRHEREQVRAKYQGYLQQVWRQPDNCPICDSTYWNLGDLVDSPLRGVAADLLGLEQPQKVYVYAPVTCLYCGFTMFFHTGVLDTRGTEEVKAVPPLRAPKEER